MASRDKEVVQLEEEMHFIESYVFLQQIRFGDKLKISIELSDVKSMVAPMALQMLVENAIKHNEISEDHPLAIRIYSRNKKIVIENSLRRRPVLEERFTGPGA